MKEAQQKTIKKKNQGKNLTWDRKIAHQNKKAASTKTQPT